MFYPIDACGGGRRGHALREQGRADRSGCAAAGPQIPSEGLGALGGPFNSAGVGSFQPGDGRNRCLTSTGDLRTMRRPRRAQPREARKGLPVTPVGGGAEPRTTRARRVGGGFSLRASEIAGESPAETVPGLTPGAYVCGSGAKGP